MIRWKNATFYTMDSTHTTVNEVVTDQGKIIAVGTKAKDIKVNQEIDLNGSFVFPGFVDSHLHILGYGQKITRPSLGFTKDKQKAMRLIKEAFLDAPLFVHDYYDIGVTKEDLDTVSVDHPVLLRHNDYHSVTVNSWVLDKLQKQNSNGILKEEAGNEALALFDDYKKDTLESYFKNAVTSLWSYGITGGHSDDLHYFNGFRNTLSVFQDTLPDYPFRAHLLVHYQEVEEFIKSKLPFLDQNPYLQLGAVKLFYDGTVSSKTALFEAGYVDGTMGERLWNRSEFEEEVRKMREYKLPVAVHVIGDLASLEVLEVIKKYPPLLGQHDRLIHCSFLSEAFLKEASKLPIFIDAQPQFLSSDLPWGLQDLKKTPEYVYPWKSILQYQIPMGFGSDAPVEIPNPLYGIYDAQYRIAKEDGKVYQVEERISRYEAIELYTSKANFATYHKNRGKIEVGHIADFTVFHEDILQISKEALKASKVYMTVVDEKVVYQKRNAH